jgi:hypothetical protein
MAVLSMSKQEFSRLDVLLRVQSGRLRVADACALAAQGCHLYFARRVTFLSCADTACM